MDSLIIFTCIFVPTFVLNLLSAGRDELLFQERKKPNRWLVLLLMALGIMVLRLVGLPLPLALALVLPGPMASELGHWIGSGDWIVARHRLGRLFTRH
jgi:hypothetical protein